MKMDQTWPGAKPFAWIWLLILWNIGGLVGGYMGYWPVLVQQATTAWQAAAAGKGVEAMFFSWRFFEGRMALLTTALATLLYKTAYGVISGWEGRRLSMFSLLVFPVLNAIGEGFILLACFDLGRWYLGNEKVEVLRWVVAVPALGRITPDNGTFWQEFIVGAVPYALVSGLMLLHFWQGWVLPGSVSPDALRHVSSLSLLIQFGYMALYFFGGDVLSFILLRWAADVLTVLATRLPPPLAFPPPAVRNTATETKKTK